MADVTAANGDVSSRLHKEFGNEWMMMPAEVATFYFDELPAQGYTMANGSQPSSVEDLAEFVENGVETFTLVFDGPDGIPLQLNIAAGHTGGNSTMNINRFRSGTR